MKRQHPENPDLFWCPKCKEYKTKERFSKNKGSRFRIHTYCKPCALIIKAEYRKKNLKTVKKQESANRERHREERREGARTYQRLYREEIRKRRILNPRKRVARKRYVEWERGYEKKARKTLKDNYIKKLLHKRGMPITPEIIKLKRQQITMRRTLKEFKQWRQENESNHADVDAKQFENEDNNERRIQAG